ncbi:MAG: site-specific DNA-methyltransferase [Desulfobacterales bacterium]|nr:site-specific DNA-methyltransferase [Desulfobacterales bacterium]
METTHYPIIEDCTTMSQVTDCSIDLVVTSPPYPMIQMWDSGFTQAVPEIGDLLATGKGTAAFEAMHQVLDPVWAECFRVLKPGGFACINIGDATRTLADHFALYPNHARIISATQALGFTVLPCILWRKQTNAPNKYMGSGMLPAGAYVTLEHEYILILRKGGKRQFTSQTERKLRQESALFWEERNTWFSDIWLDLKGSRQRLNQKSDLKADRKRSGAFPFDLAARLIAMYSLKGDRVLDPFLGTGTTIAAAMALGRHSTGYEKDPGLAPAIAAAAETAVAEGKRLAHQRLVRHLTFVLDRMDTKGPLKHRNTHYGFPVMTAQEKNLVLNDPVAIHQSEQTPFTVTYATDPQDWFCRDWEDILSGEGAELLISSLTQG